MSALGRHRWGVSLRVWLPLGLLALGLSAGMLHLGALGNQDAVLDGTGPRVAQPSGFFCLTRVGSRWTLVTPEGRPFWLRAVYGVDWTDGGPTAAAAFQRKYGGNQMSFASHAVARLKAWGFNTLAGYDSTYALPLPTYYRSSGNAQKLPFIRDLNISWYGAIDSGDLAPAPFKTLLAGAVDPAVYHGWPGHVPDVFDPNFAIYARAMAADQATKSRQTIFTEKTSTGGVPQPSLVDSPWLLATIPDDSDYLYGFGPGPEIPGIGNVVHPHIGWIIAVTRPTQTENTQVGAAGGARQTVHYPDPKVYAKAAWADYLEREYGTIAALNSAWGSNYTTFGSDGGWPHGRGLLDESGRNPWIGTDPYALSNTAPAVRRDLDAFLAIYADRYYKTVTEAIHAATPHQLIFSNMLDSFGGLSRVQVLAAAGRYCDALQVLADPRLPQVIPTTYAITGKPMFDWLGLRADADSPLGGLGLELGLHRDPDEYSTQAQRGAAYASRLQWLLNLRVGGGIEPMIGFAWWEYMDKPSEQANWGLVTTDDNAYDGHEDSTAIGHDAWGVATGGERKNYGDFLTAVERANEQIDKSIEPSVAASRSHGDGHTGAQ